MRKYQHRYTKRFQEKVDRYRSMERRIKRKVEQILEDPFLNTEPLKKKKVDLRGLRSARIGRNFRIIFAVCSECRRLELREKNILFCKDCQNWTDETVTFLTVAPHKEAYEIQ